MNTRILVLALTSLFGPYLYAQKGTVELSDSMHSDILNIYVRYSVYLPPVNPLRDTVFPVVYLLHGLGGAENDFLTGFRLGAKMDSFIAHRMLPPAAIVCPDGFRTFYTNDLTGKFRYEDFFMQEFMPFIEKKYNIGGRKEKRNIAGISMGGYGALKMAMKYPDSFAVAAGLSAAVKPDSVIMRLSALEWKDRSFDKIYGPSTGRRLSRAWYENSVLRLAETKPAESLQKVRYWLDCGDDDDYQEDGNYELHKTLKKRKVYHEYRVRDGGHDWKYWTSGLLPALQFILKK